MAKFPHPLAVAFPNIASQGKGSVGLWDFWAIVDSEKVEVGKVSVEFPAVLTKTAYTCACTSKAPSF